ncbi:hypothetical protein BLNAU_13077 [Blattamonas nauphoetae]|uniref:Uncharacterized protein n=1 Tax=Blattamonas nauphoetae TaxID=2049346 RepID=A0ABQ9XKR2_9EUKA|nr:hypothetical protein BLNAU_13077 [Blattamonas nauphoetae]
MMEPGEQENLSSAAAVDEQQPQNRDSNMVFVLFEMVSKSTTPIRLFLPLNKSLTIADAKHQFNGWFACQYTEKYAQTIKWISISSLYSNDEEPKNLTEDDDRREIGSLIQTGHPPDMPGLPSLLKISFSSEVEEEPQFARYTQAPDFQDNNPPAPLKEVFPKIARNVLTAIDSSFGPLSQTKFPNYNLRPSEIMPLDKSKFMVKTLNSLRNTENLETDIKDILFRSSSYSLISHILFNAQMFAQNCTRSPAPPMVHIVTGSPGIGKSALRFPIITMALSLDAKVCNFVLFILVLNPKQMNPSEQYVLLSSPNRIRWNKVTSRKGLATIPYVMYVVPGYTLAEVTNMLNSIPNNNPESKSESESESEFESESESESVGEVLMKAVRIRGFTPRAIQYYIQKGMNSAEEDKSKKKTIVEGDIFGQSISHELIVLDCPQADPHNYTMAYASQDAWNDIKKAWTEQLLAHYNFYFDSQDAPPPVITDLPDPNKAALFQQLSNRQIRMGAQFSKLMVNNKRITLSDTKLPSFPPTPARSAVNTSGSCNSHHTFLPDMTLFECSERNEFKADLWGDYFKNPMKDTSFMRGPAVLRNGKFVFENKGTSTPIETGGSGQRNDDHLPDDKLHYFTFHLIPLGERNAGFDSILLFFRVNTDNTIHSLSVHFLQSTIGKEHGISLIGANLMNTWLFLLMDVYKLNANQIYPHFMFVVSERVFEHFVPKQIDNILYFIPEENITIAALSDKTGIPLNEIEIEEEDLLILDTGKRLPRNDDTMCVRCGFCGKVLGDFFCRHRCEFAVRGESNLTFHKRILNPAERHTLFVETPGEKAAQLESIKTFLDDDDPTFVYTRKTLQERDDSNKAQQANSLSETNAIGIRIEYLETKEIPNMRKSGVKLTLILMNVTMVKPPQDVSESTPTPPIQAIPPALSTPDQKLDASTTTNAISAQTNTVNTLRKRLLTDSFDNANAEPEKLLSMAIAFCDKEPLPYPCWLYRTPLYAPSHKATNSDTQSSQSIPGTEIREMYLFEQGSVPMAPLSNRPTTAQNASDGKVVALEEKNRQKNIHRTLNTHLNPSPFLNADLAGVQPTGRVSEQKKGTTYKASTILDWINGSWIEFQKIGNVYYGKAVSHTPYEALEFEDPSEHLNRSGEYLGQMMLPFEHVGELRERIQRSLPNLHPFVIIDLTDVEREAHAPMMKFLLVVQQELELFWQVLSQMRTSVTEFVRPPDHIVQEIHSILHETWNLLVSIGLLLPSFFRLCDFLLSKIAIVRIRLDSFQENHEISFQTLSEHFTHLNDLNDILAWDHLLKWKGKLHTVAPSSNNEIRPQQKELVVLDEAVRGPVFQKGQIDEDQIFFLFENKDTLLHRAWTLFSFFGPLVMTLHLRLALRPRALSLYTAPLEGEERREDDILLAMRHVCTIICFVTYHTSELFLRMNDSTYHEKKKRADECLRTMSELLEYLPEDFNNMYFTMEQLKDEIKPDPFRTLNRIRSNIQAQSGKNAIDEETPKDHQ